SGRGQVLYMLDRILNHPRQPRTPPTDLGAALGRTLAAVRRRSLFFVVSDFVSTPGWDRVLSWLGQRHEGIVVRLTDPLDMLLPDIGLVAFQDAETGEQVMIDTNDRGFRRRFIAAAERNEE